MFKSSPYSSHLHLDLDHHWIWIIITGSGSSLDMDHHHWIWIITDAISWFFSSQEVLQSQPFFMLVVGLPPCRSLVALISDPKSEWPALTSNLDSSERHSTYIWPWLIRKALSPRLRAPSNWPGASIQRMLVSLISDPKSKWLTLTSDMEGTNPLTMT